MQMVGELKAVNIILTRWWDLHKHMVLDIATWWILHGGECTLKWTKSGRWGSPQFSFLSF
jgi:hypothetical protein